MIMENAILEGPAEPQDNGCTFLWNSKVLRIPPRYSSEAHLTTCSKVMLLSYSKILRQYCLTVSFLNLYVWMNDGHLP